MTDKRSDLQKSSSVRSGDVLSIGPSALEKTKSSKIFGAIMDQVQIATQFLKMICDFLIEFAMFAKLELVSMGISGLFKVNFYGEFLTQKFDEGFSSKVEKDEETEDPKNKEIKKKFETKIGEGIAEIGGKSTVKALNDIQSLGQKVQSMRYTTPEEIESKAVRSVVPVVKGVKSPANPAKLLPPGRERAKANFRFFARKLVSNLRHIRLKALKISCEKYESNNKRSTTLDDILAAIPKNFNEIEAFLMRLINKIKQKAKTSFRNLIESLIKRAGFLFDSEFKDMIGSLFHSLNQKVNTEINLFGYLKGGVHIEIDLNATALLNQFSVLSGIDSGVKLYTDWADKLAAEHGELLQIIQIEQIKKRNLGSMRFGWIKKKDRNKNHIFRNMKRWPQRYLILSCETKAQFQITAKTNGSPSKPTKQNSITKSITNASDEYVYSLKYFRNPADKLHHSNPIILTASMWCFVDPKNENAFILMEDKNGKGYTPGDDGQSSNWDEILNAKGVTSDDEEYLEATKDMEGNCVEEPEKARDKWIEKINEAINLVKEKNA